MWTHKLARLSRSVFALFTLSPSCSSSSLCLSRVCKRHHVNHLTAHRRRKVYWHYWHNALFPDSHGSVQGVFFHLARKANEKTLLYCFHSLGVLPDPRILHIFLPPDPDTSEKMSDAYECDSQMLPNTHRCNPCAAAQRHKSNIKQVTFDAWSVVCQQKQEDMRKSTSHYIWLVWLH